jgi:flagellar basal-body rod protein FlgC
MDLFGVFQISSAGLAVEQARLAVAASNLANARTTRTAEGELYQPLAVVVRSSPARGASFAQIEAQLQADTLPRPVVASVAATQTAPRLMYDPGNPDADDRGFVALPGVDPLTIMLELVRVQRSYEANLRAFDITRHLLERTIQMGRNS